jgi:hypothetical protein
LRSGVEGRGDSHCDASEAVVLLLKGTTLSPSALPRTWRDRRWTMSAEMNRRDSPSCSVSTCKRQDGSEDALCRAWILSGDLLEISSTSINRTVDLPLRRIHFFGVYGCERGLNRMPRSPDRDLATVAQIIVCR